MMGENFFLQSFILPPTTSSSITKSVPEPMIGRFVPKGWPLLDKMSKLMLSLGKVHFKRNTM